MGPAALSRSVEFLKGSRISSERRYPVKWEQEWASARCVESTPTSRASLLIPLGVADGCALRRCAITYSSSISSKSLPRSWDADRPALCRQYWQWPRDRRRKPRTLPQRSGPSPHRRQPPWRLCPGAAQDILRHHRLVGPPSQGLQAWTYRPTRESAASLPTQPRWSQLCHSLSFPPFPL